MALTWDLEPTGHGGKDVGPRVNAEPEWWRTALWVYGGFLKIHSFSESADKLFRNIFRIYKKKRVALHQLQMFGYCGCFYTNYSKFS